jgi:hypothetical protein
MKLTIQGAAALCCSVVALGRAWKERLCVVAPFLFWNRFRQESANDCLPVSDVSIHPEGT